MKKKDEDNKKKKWLYSGVWTISSGVGINLITSVIQSSIKKTNLLTNFISNIISFFKIIGKGLWAFLNFDLKVWWILLGLATIFGILYWVVITDQDDTDNAGTEDVSGWKNYREEYYKNWLFSWEYNKYNGRTEISHLRAVCSQCSCDLSKKSSPWGRREPYLYCPNCWAEYPQLENNDLNDVEKVIIHNIKTHRWKEKIKE